MNSMSPLIYAEPEKCYERLVNFLSRQNPSNSLNDNEYTDLMIESVRLLSTDRLLNRAASVTRIIPCNRDMVNRDLLRKAISHQYSGINSMVLSNLLTNGFQSRLDQKVIAAGFKDCLGAHHSSLQYSSHEDQIRPILDSLKRYIILWKAKPEMTKQAGLQPVAYTSPRSMIGFLRTCYSQYPTTLAKAILETVHDEFQLNALITPMTTELNLLLDELNLIRILFVFYVDPKDKLAEIFGVDAKNL